jgi:hypothetical protein
MYHERPINAHPCHGTAPHALIVEFQAKPVERSLR